MCVLDSRMVSEILVYRFALVSLVYPLLLML